jgi:hypothetical protein
VFCGRRRRPHQSGRGVPIKTKKEIPMIAGILRGAYWLDAWLRSHLGRPYHVILGIGLFIEIVRQLHELGEVGESPSGILRVALAVTFYLVLLVHQFGELQAHVAARKSRTRRIMP